jgi:Icc-related predicted phosphoesterase
MYGASNGKGLPQNVHYLCNSGVTLEGIRFYGVPMFMEDEFEGNMDALYHRIPDGTHVLITHQPPFGFCDAANYGNGLSHRGSRELAERVQTLHNLRVHCFGHEHDAYGTAQLDNVLYSNAALLTHDYRLVHAPVLIEYPVII